MAAAAVICEAPQKKKKLVELRHLTGKKAIDISAIQVYTQEMNVFAWKLLF